MAIHTRIIDLYGIPACGKTTLAEYMANHPKQGLKVAAMQDCMRDAFSNKWKLVKSVSLKNFWASVRLKLSTPLIKSAQLFRLREYCFWGLSRITYVNTLITTLL